MKQQTKLQTDKNPIIYTFLHVIPEIRCPITYNSWTNYKDYM